MNKGYRVYSIIASSLAAVIAVFLLIPGFGESLPAAALPAAAATLLVVSAAGNLAGGSKQTTECILSVNETDDTADAGQRWNFLFEIFPENLLLLEESRTRIIAANRAACEELGLEKEDLAGMECKGAEPEDDITEPLISFAAAEVQNGRLVIIEQQELSGICCGRKISRQNEIFNKHIFEDLPIPMMRINFNGNVIALNESFRKLMETNSDDLETLTDSAVFFANSVEREYLFEMVRKEETVKNMELHFKTPGGSSIDALVTAYSMTDSSGLRFMEASLIDITMLKKLEEDRKKLENLKYKNKYMDSINKLAAGIAHDINNILAGIQGHAQVLQYKLEEDEKLTKSVQRIISAVSRADTILQGLLSSIGAYDYQPVILELGSFIRSSLQDIEKTADIRDLYRIINMDSMIRLNADPLLLRDALLEIVKNARNATGGKEEILITSSIEKPHHVITSFLADNNEKCACLSVIDRGPGMSPETIEKIFEPYFTTMDFGSGAGLGMTRVYGIISRHEGAIGIMNEPGKGTTVSLFFKLSENRAEVKPVV